jgi:peptide/nickel transport system permease protein
MQAYLARRLFLAVFVIFGVTIIAFATVHFIPADVVDLILGKRSTPQAEAALRHNLGLDQPPVQQYMRWLGRLLHGDLGLSLRTREPIADLLRQRLPVTLELALLATLVAVCVGIPTGIIAAVRQYSVADQASTVISMVGLSTPDFWLATLLILALSVTWKLLPPGGLLPSLFDDPIENLKRMFMPVLSMGLPSGAIYFRMMRSSMLEVIRSDYMVTAYSKGLAERRAILVHGLKNALIPVITVTGLEVTYLLGGSFIIESIFSLPGLGRATVQAIYERDYTVLQACLITYSFMVVVISIGVDFVYSWLDPRIRFD